MLKDKVYRYRTISTGDTTQLLPYDFFGDHMPISLATEDVIDISGHIPTDGDFKPKRCFYLDDIDKYVILDVGGGYSAPAGPLPEAVVDTADYINPAQTVDGKDATPIEAGNVLINPEEYKPQTVYVYLVDGTTHEMVCSYMYAVEVCPEYKLYDEVVDMCVSHDDMSGYIKVTFLIANVPLRSVYMARYRLCYATLGQPNNDGEGGIVTQIHLEDLDFFNVLVPPGKQDEIALGWHTESAHVPGFTWVYVVMEPNTIVPKLKTFMCCGKINPQYCTLTADEAGRYSIFIQSRIKVWAGPFLNFYVDAQYVVVCDNDGMNQHFILIGPAENAMSFDEFEQHQPYKYNLTTYDARYLLCLEDRKKRFLNFKRVYVGSATETPGDSYIESTKDWEGGEIAGVYYPKRASRASPPYGGNISYVGYPTEWEQTSYQEPKTMESIWTLVDICDVYGGLTSSVANSETRGFSADVVFLFDTTTTTDSILAKAGDNIENFVNTLSALGVTDWRVAVAAYSSTQEAIFNDTMTPPSMWSYGVPGTRNMANQLTVGRPASSSAVEEAWHFSAIRWASDYYAWREADAKCIVLITNGVDENDAVDPLSATGALSAKNIKGFVAGYDSSYFEPIWKDTSGAFTNVSGSWGSTLAYELGSQIAEEKGVTDSNNWWKIAATAWHPVVLYQFTPSTSWGNNSFVSVFHDNLTYIMSNHIIRSKVNYLVVYDNYPALGGKPQNSIFLTGLVPDETVTSQYVIKNESNTGTMKRISLALLDAPADVTVSISGMPNSLEPGETAVISVEAEYHPSDLSIGSRHIEVRYRVAYWMQHKLYCTDIPSSIIIDPDNPDPSPIVPGTKGDLYWVPSTRQEEFVAGWRKQIGWDPLYTLAYITRVETFTGDACYQPTWRDYRVYFTTEKEAKHCLYKVLDPKPITALEGTKACPCKDCVTWLKIRGPLYWQTIRDYECRVNKKTWYMVNTSSTATYIAYPVFDKSTMPDLAGSGFIIVTYPEGNVIGPGQSRPVDMYWVPIFNKDGEEITKATKDYRLEDTQEGAISTVWDLNPGLFNNLIYTIPEGSMDTVITHTYIENIFGDGMDIPIKPDQPLNKMDVKALEPYIYHTQTWLDVDASLLPTGYRYLVPAGVWGGIPTDEGGEKELPAGAKPEDMYEYKEYLSPAKGVESIPEYVDHKFKPNPEMLFNADSEHPYQLAPFNQEYADPYMATLFVGNVVIRSSTLGNVRFTEPNTYNDINSDFVPCDEEGNELLGWEIKDFWPVPGNFEESVKKLATENDYYFKKTVYAKNRTVDKTLALKIQPEKTDLPGFSLDGVTIISPGPTLGPGEIAELEVTFRFHFTYQKAKYLNMIEETVFVPVFEKTTTL